MIGMISPTGQTYTTRLNKNEAQVTISKLTTTATALGHDLHSRGRKETEDFYEPGGG